MDRETKSAFERADVVFKEVRILVEIDGFKGKFPESLSSVCVGS